MTIPTIIERVIPLEPVTRDDFADSPAPADANRRPAHRFVRASV